jgi:uncharacterized membrane protein YjgN (DUF898 family)
MKNYLSFHLKGEDIFSYFIIILLVLIIPTIYFSVNPEPYYHENLNFWRVIFLILTVLTISFVVLILSLFILKQSIDSVEFKAERIKFSGDIGEYLGIVIKGVLLTIITLGIYSPWFQRDLQRFYIGRTSYQDNDFEFLGKGEDLFVIFIAAFIVPYVFLAIIFDNSLFNERAFSSFRAYFFNLLTTAVIAPFMFFYYRWFINIRYKELIGKIDCTPGEGIGMVLVQTLISAATFGIYFPIATLKIYQFYLNRIQVSGEGE